MAERLLREIKYSFRELCGVLSIEELITNDALIDSITRVEHLLIGLEL